MLFKDHLGINYASRAGARIGVAASKRADADCSILRAISSTLQTMEYDNFVLARIYRANGPDDTCTGPCMENIWGRTRVQGPDCDLNTNRHAGWYPITTLGYQPTARENRDDPNQGFTADGLGIEVQYTHRFFFNYVPGADSTAVIVRDTAVMQIEPPKFRPVP
jgi:hypothetical protein